MYAIKVDSEYEEYELYESFDNEYFELILEYVNDMKSIPNRFTVITDNGDEFVTNVSQWLTKKQIAELEKLL
jgi:hypothetical protein